VEIVHRWCCGLDVHRKSVAANLLCRSPAGAEEIDEMRTFATTTGELLELADWLKEAGCTHVALESTGVYWKPIFIILEEDFEVVLVNAKHIKNVAGQKTDVGTAAGLRSCSSMGWCGAASSRRDRFASCAI